MNTLRPAMIAHMREFIEHHDLTESFCNHVPSVQTGYAYDASPLIQKIKKGVEADGHSDASFALCCAKLKSIMERDLKIQSERDLVFRCESTGVIV